MTESVGPLAFPPASLLVGKVAAGQPILAVENIQDTVKVVLHVQVQQGWDAVVPDAMQLLPLTRPRR